MIKLVLSDMDNTLNPVGSPRVSERTVKAIKACREAGIHFAPCTGRDVEALLHFFHDQEDCIEDVVSLNGKLVYSNHELIAQHPLDNDALRRLDIFLRQIPGACLAVDIARDTIQETLCVDPTPENVMFVQGVMGHLTTWHYRVPDTPIYAAAVILTGNDYDQAMLQSLINSIIPEVKLVKPFSRWLDVLPTGIDKGTGIIELCDHLGIMFDEIVAFGDSQNDFPMFDLVPYSVTVANAMPAAWDRTRYHVGACAEDGVAIALEQLVKAQAKGKLPKYLRDK